ncbi:MAG TPA: ATP-binding cassette domain-containing protein [Niabella sp.]|nr:ATP-binding cassette domain-containing protein [Niabella sp.]HOZ97604.1 ATP-binding cassette domain-containing protein [Niabella sp.]HQW15742.1 ATP-binding cassette domain-containing protein [Niabella sp.]HQX21017.1 ATP-binding cassette domain-containing protein [Niabella sp.]HQX41886.1 ATP-binding cassette domain-containing protein [Niabella sp.]
MTEIVQLKKFYGSHQILEISNLQLSKGVYWIKGANGSGKSTLLKVLAGLLPFAGEILIDQISIKKQPVAYRSAINYAPAEPVYPSFLSGQELVNFYSKIKKGTTQQLEELKSVLGIDDYLKNPVGSYSSGMIKKLSLLLALTGKSNWIFLDEPFTTLDVSSQKALSRFIQSNSDTGFLLTSHHDILPEDIRLKGVYHLKNKKLEAEKY